MMMTKNYFTDGQILKLVFDKFKADGVDMRNIDNIPSEQEIKDLKQFANLAVEAAIGEPVRTITLKSNGWYEKHNEYDNKDIEHCIKEKIYVRNLYSVKELEN